MRHDIAFDFILFLEVDDILTVVVDLKLRLLIHEVLLDKDLDVSQGFDDSLDAQIFVESLGSNVVQFVQSHVFLGLQQGFFEAGALGNDEHLYHVGPRHVDPVEVLDFRLNRSVSQLERCLDLVDLSCLLEQGVVRGSSQEDLVQRFHVEAELLDGSKQQCEAHKDGLLDTSKLCQQV